jgi:hypothetical protein
MTMKCLGAGSNRADLDFAVDEGMELSAESLSPKAEDEVIRSVTKSRGVVGPGN